MNATANIYVLPMRYYLNISSKYDALTNTFRIIVKKRHDRSEGIEIGDDGVLMC